MAGTPLLSCSLLMKAAKYRFGRLYRAYFFEKPTVFPVAVIVVAQSFEQAVALVREQFPDRTISGFYADDNFRIVEDFSAVIVAPNLPKTKPRDVRRDVHGVPEELSRGWSNIDTSGNKIEWPDPETEALAVPSIADCFKNV